MKKCLLSSAGLAALISLASAGSVSAHVANNDAVLDKMEKQQTVTSTASSNMLDIEIINIDGNNGFDVAVGIDDQLVQEDCACATGSAFFQGSGGTAGAVIGGATTGGLGGQVLGGGIGAAVGEGLHQGMHALPDMLDSMGDAMQEHFDVTGEGTFTGPKY